MFTLLEALNYRCLKYVNQPLKPFHVLIGPNASGKTTFLDVIAFLGDLVSNGLDDAISERTHNFIDLVWGRTEGSIEIAIEAKVPEKLLLKSNTHYNIIRYEIKVGIDNGENAILAEKALLKIKQPEKYIQRYLFPTLVETPHTIITPKAKKNTRTVINKVYGGNDNYYSEVYSDAGKGWAPAFKLGLRKSALGNLPEDESKFPITTWLKRFLAEGVQKFVLNSMLITQLSQYES